MLRKCRAPVDLRRAKLYHLMSFLDQHEQGICHRDLKPENLLLDEHSNLKISDFGLSSLHNNNGEATLTSSKMLHTTCGSPNYVSPEVLDGEGYDGRRADIWTLGVILYVMATGRLPFDDSNITTLFEKIQRAQFRAFPSSSTAAFRDLVSRLLLVNPRERLQLSDIQQHPWYTQGLNSRPNERLDHL